MLLVNSSLLSAIQQIQIPSRRRIRAQERGEKTGLKKGSSVEFSDYREYLQGDDIRSIDWNVYARTERLFLKLFLEEQTKPVYFIVDASQSMGFGSPSKFDYAVSLAAALVFVCLKHYDRPRILLLRDTRFDQFFFSSQKQFFPLIKHIEEQTPSGETHLTSGLKKVALARFPHGIYFLLSDFYSPDGFGGLKVLAAAGNEIHCLQILTDEELRPVLRGDLKLVDSETASHTEVSINPQTLKRYLARLAALQQDVRNTAHKAGADFYAICTSTPLDSLILKDLRKAGIVT